MGDRFQWIYPNTAELYPSGADPLNETESSVAMIGFETLSAVKLACDMAGCSREEVEDIMRKFRCARPPGSVPEQLFWWTNFASRCFVVAGGR